MLIEDVEKGTRDSSVQAEKLAKKFPDAALGPILTGIHRAKDGWLRTSLVRTIDDMEGDKVIPVSS